MADLEKVPEPVVVCLGGMVSSNCSTSIDVVLEDYSKLVDVVDAVWGEGPNRPILFVAPSLRGFSGFLRSLGEMGRNPFLVEVTGIPETILSGLTLDALIEFYAGFITVTLPERLRAVKKRPTVTRRELFRRFFVVAPEYVIPPRLPRGCGGGCPLGAIDDGRVDVAKCRGCMVCIHGCNSVPHWTGVASLAYAYRYIAEHGLDGILFICRDRLDLLDEKAIEASPAKLLPFHVPCAGWLSPRVLSKLRELSIYVHVLAGPGVCGGCSRWSPLKESGLIDVLRESNIGVGGNLAEASAHAFSGYSRRKMSLEEVIDALSDALGRSEQG